MYIAGVKIENFRGVGKETIFKFNPGIRFWLEKMILESLQ